MMIQHEDTGAVAELPDVEPIPRRWHEIPSPASTACSNEFITVVDMTFDEWWGKQSPDYLDEITAREAWNAAIDAADSAIESADHNDDVSGHGANCNAMIAVEKLKAL